MSLCLCAYLCLSLYLDLCLYLYLYLYHLFVYLCQFKDISVPAEMSLIDFDPASKTHQIFMISLSHFLFCFLIGQHAYQQFNTKLDVTTFCNLAKSNFSDCKISYWINPFDTALIQLRLFLNCFVVFPHLRTFWWYNNHQIYEQMRVLNFQGLPCHTRTPQFDDIIILI